MYHRLLTPRFNNSFFILGPRGTGKSTLLETWKKELKLNPEKTVSYNLLDPELEKKFILNPNALKQLIIGDPKKIEWCIIDEVQKCPELLNIAHDLIESKKIKFILTGSSARKLKRGNANLLAGRAFEYALHPLTSSEIGKKFNLIQSLTYGNLPKILFYSDERDKKKFLSSYVNTYLKEEIIAEQIIRKIDRFRHFLPVAAQANGQILNYAKIHQQSGVEEKSVARFFEVLVDTLVGFYLEPFSLSVRKQQYKKPKFYFFDTGVTRAMADRLEYDLLPETREFGWAFEQFIILELRNRVEYEEKNIKFSYLSTPNGVEIDLVLQKNSKINFLIEIKSADFFNESHAKNLRSLTNDFKNYKRIILYRGKDNLTLEDGIEVYPWNVGIDKIISLL